MRSRRREMDLGIGLFTHEDDAKALEREYTETVGWALQYGIKTYLPGTGHPGDLGPWEKPLKQLRAEVREHESNERWKAQAEAAYYARFAKEAYRLDEHQMQDLFREIERSRAKLDAMTASLYLPPQPWWKRLLGLV